MFFGGLFLAIPVVGHVVVLGYLASMALYGIENAIVVGELSALGAALYGIGVPKDSVIQYETALKADSFLVMAHGTAEEVARAKTILGTANPSRIDVHTGAKTARPADRPYGLNRAAKMEARSTDASFCDASRECARPDGDRHR